MELDALVRRISLTIDPPSLGNTASDWERLVRALRPHLDDRPLEPTLAAHGSVVVSIGDIAPLQGSGPPQGSNQIKEKMNDSSCNANPNGDQRAGG
jgi:hypothetical protein